MAGASEKKTAARNDAAIRNLQIVFAVVSFGSIIIRFLMGRIGLSSPIKHWIFLALPFAPSITLTNYLIGIATPRRDHLGRVVYPGADLDQGGITEYAFDILYLTWACQVGSALFGGPFWLVYLLIPGFAFFKLWTLIIYPFFVANKSSGPEEETQASSQSKRQQKLQARADRGDPRVRAANRS